MLEYESEQFSGDNFGEIERLLADPINQRLIDALVKDGRASYAELGRQLHLSRSTVRDRIQALVQAEIIEQFTVILDPEKLGLTLSAFFEVDVEPSRLEHVAGQIAKQQCVVNIYQRTGPSRLHLHALFRSIRKMQEFMDYIYSLGGIQRVGSHMLIKRFKSRAGIRV